MTVNAPCGNVMLVGHQDSRGRLHHSWQWWFYCQQCQCTGRSATQAALPAPPLLPPPPISASASNAAAAVPIPTHWRACVRDDGWSQAGWCAKPPPLRLDGDVSSWNTLASPVPWTKPGGSCGAGSTLLAPVETASRNQFYITQRTYVG